MTLLSLRELLKLHLLGDQQASKELADYFLDEDDEEGARLVRSRQMIYVLGAQLRVVTFDGSVGVELASFLQGKQGETDRRSLGCVAAPSESKRAALGTVLVVVDTPLQDETVVLESSPESGLRITLPRGVTRVFNPEGNTVDYCYHSATSGVAEGNACVVL